MAKKFKIKYVKNIFCPKHHRGNDWAEPMTLDYELGTNHTESLNKYMYNQNYIGLICSDYLDGDPRKYKRGAKFSLAEASILLLKLIEDNLKSARQEKKRLDKAQEDRVRAGINLSDGMLIYCRSVNNRELLFNERQAKIWRKKVREIKKSPEYLWEQLSK